MGEIEYGASRARINRWSGRRYLKWVRWNQLLAYWISRLGGGIVFRRRVRIELKTGDLDRSYRYIVAANHQSRVDPFIICGNVPPGIWNKLGTFRYLAHNGLFSHWWLRRQLVNLGCFPTRPLGDMPSGLDAAERFLAQGQSIFIFPEGSRSLPGSARAHHGVEVLSADPKVRVIPVHLRWHKSAGWRRSYRITIGRPLSAAPSAEAVLEAIYALELP